MIRQDILIRERGAVLKKNPSKSAGVLMKRKKLIRTDSQNPDPSPIARGRWTENGFSVEFRGLQKKL